MADEKGTCEACGKGGFVSTANLCCESCGATSKIKACKACMGKGGTMSKFGGRKCKACGGNMVLKACRASSVPTSYSMLKKSMLDGMIPKG